MRVQWVSFLDFCEDFCKLVHVCLLSRFHIIIRRDKKYVYSWTFICFYSEPLARARHNYFLHNLQLFADFDFSVLQRVKVANTRSPQPRPWLVQKTEFWAQTRPLPPDWARGHTKIKILIKHCDKRKLKMCKFMIVQVIFFRCKFKAVWLGFRTFCQI